MGKRHLTAEERQARKDAAYQAKLERNRSTGWVAKDAALYDDEHTPEFPSPQGPNVIGLVEEAQRQQVLRQDKFDRLYERWGNWPGKALKF